MITKYIYEDTAVAVVMSGNLGALARPTSSALPICAFQSNFLVLRREAINLTCSGALDDRLLLQTGCPGRGHKGE